MRTPEAPSGSRDFVAPRPRRPEHLSPPLDSPTMQKAALHARVAAAGLVLVLVTGAVVSAAEGVSLWYARDGAELVRVASEHGETLGDARLASAIARTRTARAWYPWSPEVAAQLGALTLTRAIGMGVTEGAAAQAAAAIAPYEHALQGRPSSGYFWSGLATSRLLARHSPGSVEYALRRASVFGGWDPAVRRRVIWLGMSAWSMLGQSARAELRTLVRRELERDEDFVYELAAGAGWTLELRLLLANPAQRARFDRHLAERRESRSGGSAQ